MALGQEFWLQQRRRQAADQSGGVRSGSGGLVPISLQSNNPIAGMNFFLGAVQSHQDKKDWNSDDEEIDEWGRKKKKRDAAKSSSSTSAAKEKRPDPETSDAGRKATKANSSNLSAKQQAALERLNNRSKATQARSTSDSTVTSASNGLEGRSAAEFAAAPAVGPAPDSAIHGQALWQLQQLQQLQQQHQQQQPWSALALSPGGAIPGQTPQTAWHGNAMPGSMPQFGGSFPPQMPLTASCPAALGGVQPCPRWASQMVNAPRWPLSPRSRSRSPPR